MASKATVSQKQIVVSTKTVITTLLVVLLSWLLYQVRFIALAVFVALILTLAFDPLVTWLQKRRVPRGAGVTFTYVLVMVLFIVLGGIGFGSLADQFKDLISQLKRSADALARIPTVGPYLRAGTEGFLAEITPIAGSNVFRVTVSAFSSVASIITVLIFTAYLLLDFQNVRGMFLNLFSRPARLRVEKTMREIELKLGSWLRAQLILMVVVGGFTYLGLWALGIRLALPLSLVAGLFEVIPLIGPVVSAIPAVIVGFSISPMAGVGVLVLYILVQQLENNFFVPKVMQKTVGLNPLATMLALMVGGKLFGFTGVLLAVPVTLTGFIVVKNLLE